MAPRITEVELLAYAAGELQGAEAARIEAHLQADAAARATVARYRAARQAMRGADEEAPAPEAVSRAKAIFSRAAPQARTSWLERLDEVVGRLVFDSRLQPVLAGFRGGSEQFQAAWETDGAEIEIEGALVDIGRRPGVPRRWQVTGQVSPQVPARVISVALTRPGTRETVAQADADDSGMFTFEAAADRYDLMVRIDDRAVVVSDLELA